MINDNHELLIELWSRIKSHIPPKERLEVADTLVVVFDEFSLLEDSFLDEDLDKELRAAAKSHLTVVDVDNEDQDDDDYSE
jgi:hypothetical protein